MLTIASNAFCRETSPSSPCAPSFRAKFSCLGTDNFPRKHAFNSCRAVFHHPNAQKLAIATARRFLPPQKACPRVYYRNAGARVYYRKMQYDAKIFILYQRIRKNAKAQKPSLPYRCTTETVLMLEKQINYLERIRRNSITYYRQII